MHKQRRYVALLGLGVAVGMCGCGLFHGDPNDYERGSGGVGVLQPRLQPPANPNPSSRPILPTSETVR
jgi:hypothetical protein